MKTKRKDVFPASLQAARSLLEQWTNPNNSNNTNNERNNERKDKPNDNNETEEKRGAAFVQTEKHHKGVNCHCCDEEGHHKSSCKKLKADIEAGICAPAGKRIT